MFYRPFLPTTNLPENLLRTTSPTVAQDNTSIKNQLTGFYMISSLSVWNDLNIISRVLIIPSVRKQKGKS